MSLALSLLPFEHDDNSLAFSQTVLACAPEDRDFFSDIKVLEKKDGQRVPKNFHSYLCMDNDEGEPCYGVTVITPYGDPLYTLTVLDLLIFKDDEGIKENKNKSVWAYLASLNPYTRVALFWS